MPQKKRSRSPERLETLSLKRVCKDVGRHALSHQEQSSTAVDNEVTDYSHFQMIFGNSVVEELFGTDKDFVNRVKVTSATKKRFLKYGPTAYCSSMKFIFNPFLKHIHINEMMDFNEDIVSIIASNCSQNLHSLKIEKKDIGSPSAIGLLKSLKNLVSLELYFCAFDKIPTMRVIADSLLHLKSLRLTYDTLEDDVLFLLGGHDSPVADSISECCFSKSCNAKCNLELQEIELTGKGLTIKGLACLLTHIPTLKYLMCNPDASEVIYEIAEYRKARGIPGIRLNLEGEFIVYVPTFLKASIEACPNLGRMFLHFGSVPEFVLTCTILEESELKNLSFISISGEGYCVDVESFHNFWAQNAPRLKDVQLSLEEITVEQGGLQFLLQCCTYVSSLTLTLREFQIKSSGSETFADNLCLKDLDLTLEGDEACINNFARKLILGAPNLEMLTLSFPVRDDTIFPVLSENHLKCLRKVVLCVSNAKQTENLDKFLCSGTRKVEIVGSY